MTNRNHQPTTLNLPAHSSLRGIPPYWLESWEAILGRVTRALGQPHYRYFVEYLGPRRCLTCPMAHECDIPQECAVWESQEDQVAILMVFAPTISPSELGLVADDSAWEERLSNFANWARLSLEDVGLHAQVTWSGSLLDALCPQVKAPAGESMGPATLLQHTPAARIMVAQSGRPNR